MSKTAQISDSSILSDVTFSKYDERHVHAWEEDGMIYVAFNHPSRPVIPPYTNTFSDGRLKKTDLRQLSWVRSGYIYLAFLPFPLSLRYPLLCRLNIDENRMPITQRHIRSESSWIFDSKLADSWMRLFDGLQQVSDILIPYTGFSSNIILPPIPPFRRLSNSFSSKEKCAKFVVEVKEAFFPWLALVSFCIACLDGTATFRMKTGAAEQHHVWIGRLYTSNIHPGWVGWLVNSPLSWFNRTTRLGTIIHFERDIYAINIHFLSKHNVPTVYCLHESNQSGLPSNQITPEYLAWFRLFHPKASMDDMGLHLRKFVPPSHAIKRHFSSGTTSTVLGSVDQRSPEGNGTKAFPELDRQSGQKEFETREQFLARREKENIALIEKETPKEKQRREGRLRSSESFNPPGRGSTTRVFVWEKIDGWEVRVLQTSAMFEVLFCSMHTKEEMKFDPVRNEWDLWTSNHTSFKPPEDDDSEGSEWDKEDGWRDGGGIDVFERDLIEESGGDMVSPEEILISNRTAEAQRVSKIVSLESMLRIWYGFTPSDTIFPFLELPVDTTSEIKEIFKNLGKENRLKAIFVDSVSEDPNHVFAVRYFLAHCISGAPAPLKSFSDLNNLSIARFRRSRIRLLPSKYSTSFKAGNTPMSQNSLYEIEIRDERGHRVQDRDDRRLFFWSATAVVAVLRLNPDTTKTISHIAEQMVEMGIAFLMAIPRSRVLPPPQDVRVTGLGRRWRRYKPDKGDYVMYQQKCLELFSVRRIRRALRCGGILRRIAMDYIDLDEALDGPVYEASNEPLWVCNSQTGRSEFVEDGLSVEEIHLLIGAFELRDEESKDKSVFCSYWPPPWIWESSGYNVGYWTPDCEDWFTNRLKKIRDGTTNDHLLSVEEWKGFLKRFRQTKKLAATVENHCADFLKGLTDY